MRTPASICKHPIHPMLVVFPIGLWIFSLACDLRRLAGASAETWSTVAFITMVGGLIGALGAAISGAIDLVYYKEGAPPVKKIALTHMAINLTAVVLYAINVRLRVRGPSPMDAGISAPVLLSIVGVALIAVSGWLGGQMVHVHGVGVEGREWRMPRAAARSLARFNSQKKVRWQMLHGLKDRRGQGRHAAVCL